MADFNQQAFGTNLRTWIVRELGVIYGASMANKVIFARQSAPRPKMPYAAIDFIAPGVRVGGIDEVRYDEDQEKFFQAGFRTTTVTIDILGDRANDALSRLLDTLDFPTVVQEMQGYGIAHIGENGPFDLTEFEDTKDVERAQLNLTFSYSIERYETEAAPIGAIESVEVTLTDSPAGGDDEVIDVGDVPEPTP